MKYNVKSRQKALLVAEVAKLNKGEDIVILDMRKLSNITDFFIILTVTSTRRAQTISDKIKETLKSKRESLCSTEGYLEATWILIDAYDVVTHIFNDELRKFYNLESLWGDAKRIRLCQKKRKKVSKKISKRK